MFVDEESSSPQALRKRAGRVHPPSDRRHIMNNDKKDKQFVVRRKKRPRESKHYGMAVLSRWISSIGSVLSLGVFTSGFKATNRRIRILIVLLLLLWIQIQYDPFMTWRKVDHWLSYRVMAQHFASEQQAQQQQYLLGIPPTRINHANSINTHAALREVLIRRQHRAETIQLLERQARLCSRANNDTKNEPTRVACTSIPRVVWAPSGGMPLRPGLLQTHNYTQLYFDTVEEMRHMIQDVAWNYLNATSFLPDRFLWRSDQVHNLWALCVVYLYGGVFVGIPQQQQSPFGGRPSFESALLLGQDSPFLHDNDDGTTDPFGMVVLEQSILSNNNSSDTKYYFGIRWLAASPRHALLECLLRGLLVENPLLDETTDARAPTLLIQHAITSLIKRTTSTDDFQMSEQQDWYRLSLSHGASCSRQESSSSSPITVDRVETISDPADGRTRLFLAMRHAPAIQEHSVGSSESNAAITVRIIAQDTARTEDNNNNNNNNNNSRQPKVRLQSRMRTVGAEPGWFCNRCLNWAAYGSYQKCHAVCPVAYRNLMCGGGGDVVAKYQLTKTDVDVDVIIQYPPTQSKAIPRIVHQTWFEDITYDRYPQLARLQASWRSSGWDFRFYTDTTARQYILDNYPSRFVEAFDVLIHGAFRADLFRYLVLLKDGGVYADVDVMLETNLDEFITPSMSFFAPRDIPCEYAGEPYCLWNGFIGSSPGNPIMVRVVERLVNFILDRADIYDMEKETCDREGDSMDVWKVRAQPILFLSGPCGLGVAFNEALARHSLHRIPIGWMRMDDLVFGGRLDHGDALILVGDKYDLGEFRISDPVRGLIVASTDISGLDKSPRERKAMMEEELRQTNLRLSPKPHYTKSKKGVWVWGSENVYHDNLVVNERLHLRPSVSVKS